MTTPNKKDKQNERNRAITNEKVLPEERKLASRLRQFCTYYGNERKAYLKESAVAIMELGEYYIKKASYEPTDDNSRMLQKLSFVKCCALLNGARVRFELLNDEKNQKNVSILLEKFSESLLKACGVEQRDQSLPEISKHIYKRLKKMRLASEMHLNSIPKVNEESSEQESRVTEMCIVEQVQTLYQNTTENFKDLMKTISDKCIKILGNPPCKFCQAGLGSLARGEITLYSDFEHVIILENGVENLLNYDDIKEYFRWFAVVFQSIIIGLGETFIRSVGVKSINDLYSDKTVDNWFFDNITPCGISFDGMVPHSCMNPLGRQIATEKREYKVELIQPAWLMAEYLTSDQNLKNGYYVKDILTRTCLVYGDKEVYDSFLFASIEVLMTEDMWNAVEEQSDKIAKNVNEYIRGARIELHSEAFNPKVTFYRPITAMLAYLARLHRIKACSSFDIVRSLQELGVIDEDLSHRISYAVALASKIRMEAYVATGNQRVDTAKVVLEAVGSRDSWSCYKIIQYLKIALLIIKETTDLEIDTSDVLAKFNEDFFAPNVTEDVFQLVEMGKFEEAVQLGEKHLKRIKDNLNYLKMNWLLAECYYRLTKKSNDNKSEYWSRAETVCTTLVESSECPPDSRSDAYIILSKALEFGKKYEDGVIACTCWFAMYRKYKEVSYQHHSTYLLMLRREMKMRINYMNPGEMVNFIMTIGLLEDRTDARMILWFWVAKVLSNLRHLKMVRKIFLNLVEEFRYHMRQYGSLLYLLNEIADMQMANSWLEDALVTMNFVFDAYRHMGVETESQIELDRYILDTLRRLERWEEGAEHIHLMLPMSKETNADLVKLFLSKYSVSAGTQMIDIAEEKIKNSEDIFNSVPHFSGVKKYLEGDEVGVAEFLQSIAESDSIPSILHEMIEHLPGDLRSLNDVRHYGIINKVLIVLMDHGYLILKNHLASLAKLARLHVLDYGEYISTLWKLMHSKASLSTKNMAIRFLADYISQNITEIGKVTKKPKDSMYKEDDRSFLSKAMLVNSTENLLPILRDRMSECKKHLSDTDQIDTYAEILAIMLFRLIRPYFDEVYACLVQAPKEVLNHDLLKSTISLCFLTFCEATIEVLLERYSEKRVSELILFFNLVLEKPDDSLHLELINISNQILDVSSNCQSEFDPRGSCLDLLRKLDNKELLDKKEYGQLIWKIINGKSSTERKRKAISSMLHVISTSLFAF